MFAQNMINALLNGGIYGLAALGLSLIWGVMGIVNIAHGAFIMLGAYLSYWLFQLFGMHPYLSAFLGLAVGMGFGLLIYRYLIDCLLVKVRTELERELMSLLLTFGLAILLYGVALSAWGADLRGLPLHLPTWSIGGIQIPLVRLTAFTAAIVLGTILYLFLRHTYLGKAIRAVSLSRDTAMLSGINPAQIFVIAFGIGLGYAVLAGAIISLIMPVSPFLWQTYLLRSFTVVVLGGLGNPIGAFVGGLILSLAESFTIFFVSFTWSPTVAFVLLILILIFRPTGLLPSMRQVGPLRRI